MTDQQALNNLLQFNVNDLKQRMAVLERSNYQGKNKALSLYKQAISLKGQ
jgi:hypothetical protein